MWSKLLVPSPRSLQNVLSHFQLQIGKIKCLPINVEVFINLLASSCGSAHCAGVVWTEPMTCRLKHTLNAQHNKV